MRPNSTGDSRSPGGRTDGQPGDAATAAPGRSTAVAATGPADAGDRRAAAVVLFALGGTISMARQDGGGVVARLTGRDLLGSVGGLDGMEIDVRDQITVPSASLSFGEILDVVDAADEAVHGGARGIVLTQGTDTLEETAFLVDSVWPHEAPFVLTGAMRNPTLPGADGPANLLAAIQVAMAGPARGRGALVVFSDEIHAARYVRKAHSTSTATFTSPDAGPIGHLVEFVPRFLAQVPRRVLVTSLDRDALAATRIALYTMTLDDDGLMLDRVARLITGSSWPDSASVTCPPG